MKIEKSIDVNYQLGQRVRYLRIKAKKTIEELAFESNINTNYLSDLERGNRNPTLKVINKIAIGLKISLSELLMGISGEN
jgi:Predicted transcription factor, homolog of eukaryotic MBF1